MYAISNYPQNKTQSFQGSFINAGGVALPKGKVKEVAKIVEEKVPGLPDFVVSGASRNSDFDGLFYHSTSICSGDEEIAVAVTRDFKEFFKKMSPKQIANTLITLHKHDQLSNSIALLSEQLERSNLRMANANKKVELMRASGNNEVADKFAVIAQNMQAKSEMLSAQLEKAKEKLAKIKIPGDFIV